jgi:surface polysaccharide O-acyltransferase-like enzyme
MAPITYVVGAFFYLFSHNLMDNQNQSQATSTSPKVAVVDADTSARITSLRFLLMVLIVFLHSYVEVPNEPFASHFVRTAFAGVFTRCGVPLFFFISAFLLFSKNDPYPLALKKRARSILLPYVVWTAFALAAFFALQSLPAMSGFFTHTNRIIRNFSCSDWFFSFVGTFPTHNPYPFVYQFWFLRDLMLLFLLAPIVRTLVSRYPFQVIILAVFAWFNNLNWLPLSSEAILFFVLGCYAALVRFHFSTFDSISVVSMVACYLALLTAEVLWEPQFPIIHRFTEFFGCVLMIRISACLVAIPRLFSYLKRLNAFSFWMFAMQSPLLLPAIEGAYKRCLPMSGYWMVLHYFTVALACIFLSVASGWLLRRLFPRLFSILTGGR